MKPVFTALTLLILVSLACSRTRRIPASSLTPTIIPVASATAAAQTTQPSYSHLAGQSLLDVTYCTVDGVELKMDAYFPADMSVPVPATVYVHGGAWRSGDKRSGVGRNEVSLLTSAGFAVFAVNYRLAPQYRFPAMIQDVKCAIRSLRAHASEYGIDPNRIGAFGASAGGHLVALLGTTDQSAGFEVGEYLEYSSRVQAVVDMFGPADLSLPFRDEQTQQASQVFTVDQIVTASPVTYITADDPPFLILQGDQDTVVPPQQSQVLYDRLVAAGVPATLVMVKNAGHGFTPQSGAISPNQAELALQILSFFIEHLK